jgi:hypothetical protein
MNIMHGMYNINIIQVIRSRTWAGHVTCKGESRNAYSIVKEKPEGRQTGIQATDKWIVSKWIQKKHDGSVDWVNVVQDLDKWQAFVNKVINLQDP